MKLKPYHLIFFVLGSLLVGSLVISCSHPGKKEAPAAAAQPPKQETSPAVVQPPPEKKPALISVDFDKVPLSEVVQFLSANAGKVFILNGFDTVPVSWTEFNIPREKMLDAVVKALQPAGLILKPVDPQKTMFSIEKAPEEMIPYKLNFATCSKGVYFLFGNTVISKDKFQYPLKYDAGQWYAIIPKSLAEQFEASQRAPRSELASTQTKKVNEN